MNKSAEIFWKVSSFGGKNKTKQEAADGCKGVKIQRRRGTFGETRKLEWREKSLVESCSGFFLSVCVCVCDG